MFPTTTVAALASLSTGLPPGRHGLVGYRQYLPAFGVVADMLRMAPATIPGRELLIGPEWQPEAIAGAPTLFRRGLGATVVSRDRFEGTGFTRLIYDGARYRPYATATELVHLLAEELGRRRAPASVWAYWDELDTIQHLQGIQTSLISLEIERLHHLLGALARRVPRSVARSTSVVITGDHGLVPLAPAARLDLDRFPEVVREMRQPLAGDRRAGFLTARPGRHAALRRALRRRLPRGSRLLEVPQVIRAGMFGPPPFHPELHARIGDLLVLVPAPAGLSYRAPGVAPPTRDLLAGHGGLSPSELIVPLIHGRLSEFNER